MLSFISQHLQAVIICKYDNAKRSDEPKYEKCVSALEHVIMTQYSRLTCHTAGHGVTGTNIAGK